VADPADDLADANASCAVDVLPPRNFRRPQGYIKTKTPMQVGALFRCG
jgi:hypothetical protein